MFLGLQTLFNAALISSFPLFVFAGFSHTFAIKREFLLKWIALFFFFLSLLLSVVIQMSAPRPCAPARIVPAEFIPLL